MMILLSFSKCVILYFIYTLLYKCGNIFVRKISKSWITKFNMAVFPKTQTTTSSFFTKCIVTNTE